VRVLASLRAPDPPAGKQCSPVNKKPQPALQVASRARSAPGGQVSLETHLARQPRGGCGRLSDSAPFPPHSPPASPRSAPPPRLPRLESQRARSPPLSAPQRPPATGEPARTPALPGSPPHRAAPLGALGHLRRGPLSRMHSHGCGRCGDGWICSTQPACPQFLPGAGERPVTTEALTWCAGEYWPSAFLSLTFLTCTL
jgi:hypothetical protein